MLSGISSTSLDRLIGALFRRQEQRHLLANRHFEASMCEAVDALVGVIHGQSHALPLKVVDI